MVSALKAGGEGFARGFESHRLRQGSLFSFSLGGSLSPLFAASAAHSFLPTPEGFPARGNAAFRRFSLADGHKPVQTQSV